MDKNDAYHLLKTLDEIRLIIDYSKDMSEDALHQQPAVLDEIVFRMIQMSEHMNNVSESLKIIHPEIQWGDIKGFRNRLVHNYGNVNLNFMFTAIKVDIPKLKEDLFKVIQELST